MLHRFPDDRLNSCKVARKIVKERVSKINMTTEFSRPYRDIVDTMRQWTMEEWLHFTTVFSDFIFMPHETTGTVILEGDNAVAWCCLQEACRHYLAWDPCQLSSVEEWRRSNQSAHKALIEYAQLAEQRFPSLCKFNLHMVICRLQEQAMAWGHTAKDLEFWVEREVGSLFNVNVQMNCT